MNKELEHIILQSTQATSLKKECDIQSLWSGYGVISRYALKGSEIKSVVVKHIHFPNESDHPRGWNTDLSHKRKLKSYEVEMNFYTNWASRCSQQCYVPQCFASHAHNDEALIVLEDLDVAGYNLRLRSPSMDDIHICLKWLAYFHATFMQEIPKGLWDIGTYWHLDTRPDELEVLDDQALKQAASKIDAKLQASAFQTFVHGDAKIANFCFSKDKRVAAVDFQYVGGGCGMKDVAYFIGSCLHEQDCEELEDELLNVYFSFLKEALELSEKNIDVNHLIDDWRALYSVAWADFHRFIKGWSPGHWKVNDYSERMVKHVLEAL